MTALGWAHRNVSVIIKPTVVGVVVLCRYPFYDSCCHPLDLQQLESHMKSRKAREQEAREPVLAQLRGLVSTLQSATEQMAATVSSSVRAEVQHQLHVAVGRCVDRALGEVVGQEGPE